METELIIRSESLAFPEKVIILGPLNSELFQSDLKEAGERRILLISFEDIASKVPVSMDVNKAMMEGLVGEDETSHFYDGFSDFLSQDENNRRILLYFPFELLPNLNSSEMISKELQSSEKRFAGIYREEWIKLLFEREPRASFSDGDVLEPGLGEPENISKAGHLMPEILSRGIISVQDVELILEMLPEELLTSVAEGVVVANDKGLIDISDWEKIDEIIRNRLGDLNSNDKVDPDFLNPDSPKITPERANWLRKVETEIRENYEADLLSGKIIELGVNGVLETWEGPDQTIVLGIIKVGEKLSKFDIVKAIDFCNEFRDTLQSLFDSSVPKLIDDITSGLNRWRRLGIIDDAYLKSFGTELTDLSSQNIPEELLDVFKELSDVSKKISENPILSQNLFPGFLVFGSRSKGYADLNADLDIAVFFRPSTDYANRQEVLEILGNESPQIRNIDKVLHFWTSQDEKGNFDFRFPGDVKIGRAGMDQVHFFMGGLWISASKEFEKVRSDISQRYLYLAINNNEKDESRRKFLRRIEIDVLQYRLMHKGYRKFYPLVDRPKTENSKLIDSDSDFWDPGYRRVATKLFLSKVFLPDLSFRFTQNKL